ncbi:MAG: SDR family NAD(P)-dependent oxidoreductase [Rhodospirillales bacterium]|nr:SDR family NAD(P)-dependent oxidoreductase [Rhodospirillales bacterium]
MAYDFALITGATSGIGEAFARLLPAATGLLLTGRDEARLAALAGQLGGDGRCIETLAADLAQEAGRQALIARALELPPDLLINNAGFGQFGRFAENPPEREAEMVAVNCLAPVVLTRALLPGMLVAARDDGGRAGVIVVASTAAFFPLPRLSTYTATKAFDLAFAESLAGELRGQPVDVLGLCPGPTETSFFERAGMGSASPFTKASAEQVAREGLDALGRRTVHVVGGANRLATGASRFAPRALLRAGARRAMRRLAGAR